VSGCIHVSTPHRPCKWVGCLHKSLLLLLSAPLLLLSAPLLLLAAPLLLLAAPLLLLSAPLLLLAAPLLLDEWQGSAWPYDGMQAGAMRLL
jgi:hypothetical protein